MATGKRSPTPSSEELAAALENTSRQLAICVSVLAGQDLTRHEVMVDESRPYLDAANRLLCAWRGDKW